MEFENFVNDIVFKLNNDLNTNNTDVQEYIKDFKKYINNWLTKNTNYRIKDLDKRY